jgi:hypothetical protein
MAGPAKVGERRKGERFAALGQAMKKENWKKRKENSAAAQE